MLIECFRGTTSEDNSMGLDIRILQPLPDGAFAKSRARFGPYSSRLTLQDTSGDHP